MEITANAPGGARQPVTVRLVGGSAALIEIGGLRLLTDPVLDAPGLIAGSTHSPARTGGPGAAVKVAGTIHAVLLSHDGHAGQPDGALRGRLAAAPMTLTTTEAAGRLGGNAIALPPWYHLTLDRPDGGCVKVTGTPARHGPKTAPTATSLVTGFALTGPDVPTIYISGDNASLEVVEQIAERFAPVDLALLSAGGARTRRRGGYLTLTSDQAARAAGILSARTVMPPAYRRLCAHHRGPRHAAPGVCRPRPGRSADAAGSWRAGDHVTDTARHPAAPLPVARRPWAAALTTGSQVPAGCAVTLEAAPADDLATLLMRAWRLTRREREVVCQYAAGGPWLLAGASWPL